MVVVNQQLLIVVKEPIKIFGKAMNPNSYDIKEKIR